MSLVLEFLPGAQAEVECVTGDYEARVPGLGVRFREEVESVCAAIVQHPLLWRERLGGYRRVNLPGFSHYVAFVLREERVLSLLSLPPAVIPITGRSECREYPMAYHRVESNRCQASRLRSR